MSEARLARAGPVAWRVLRSGNFSGRVVAVFERSLYFAVGEAFVCLGPSEIGDGALNVIADIAIAGVAAGMAVERAGSALRIGRDHSLSFHGMQVWQPPPWPHGWTGKSLANSYRALEAQSADTGSAPSSGLIDATNGRLEQGVSALTDWVRRATRPNQPPVQRLLGLGPGLTPSGDDVIGGALLALHALGKQDVAAALAAAVEASWRGRTSDLSHAHLAAAGEGYGAAAVHDLLARLLSGDVHTLTDQVARVTAIGHSSGTDMLAGIRLVLRAYAAGGPG